MPRRYRYLFLVLILILAGLGNGAIYLIRHQAVTSSVRAYEAQLSEIQRLQTDLETSLIYGNETRIQELIGQITDKLNALPNKTTAQKRAKAALQEVVAAAERHLRKEALLKTTPFVNLGATLPSPGPLVSWNDRVFVFSSSEPKVAEIKTAGAASSVRQLTGINVGVAQVLPATTGLVLHLTNGQLGFWNPDSNTVTTYLDANFAVETPLMFYQSRLYHAKPDGSVVRQSVQAKNLGSEIVAALATGTTVSGLAADGALYLLAPNGNVSKLIKGIPASGFKTPTPNPIVTNASGLLVGSQGNFLAYLDRAGGRMFVLDKQDGSLIATVTDDSLKNLKDWSLDEAGGRLFLGFGNEIKTVRLTDLKP